MSTATTIMISKDTREELRKQGFKDETYNEIIQKLLELSKEKLFYERQKRILETEEFVPLDQV